MLNFMILAKNQAKHPKIPLWEAFVTLVFPGKYLILPLLFRNKFANFI